MTTQKIVTIIGFLLVLALPSAVLAGSVSGMDWYSEGTVNTSNSIEQVIPAGAAVAEAGIGLDWYSEKNLATDRGYIRGSISPMDRPIGIGMDWHSEDTPTPFNAKGNCLPVGSVVSIAGNC